MSLGLVASIVQKAGTYDQKVIEESIEKLEKESAHLKGEIYELVKQEYVNFDSQVNTTVALEERVQQARSKYQKIAARIEQDLKSKIAKSRDKRGEIESKLEETQSRITFVQCLFDIFQAIEKGKLDAQSGKYMAAARGLSSAAESLNKVAENGCEAKVFCALKSEHALVVSDLTSKLQEKWQEFVRWSPKVIPSEPNLELLSRIELRLPIYQSPQHDPRREVIGGMKLLTVGGRIWEQRVQVFAKKLLRCVIKPLILHDTLQSRVVASKGDLVLSLTKSPDSSTGEARIPQLCDMLVTMFKALGSVVSEDNKVEWLQIMGEVFCPEIEELMVAHRLSTSIPKDSLELDKYEVVCAKVKWFEEELVKMGLARSGEVCKMSDYASNVNMHFVNQKNQDTLVKARSILMQSIHDTALINKVDPFAKLENVLPIPNSSTSPSSSFNLEDSTTGLDLTELNFSFPRCVVSKSVQDFVSHFYQTLEECCQCTNAAAAVQCFQTARNMVDLFCAVMSSRHKMAVADLPRVAAVQHNNCMYLAHHLVTLGHRFHCQLPPPLNSKSTTFVDQVPLVRGMGEECLLAEMRKQSSCLLGFLKSFGTFSGVSKDLQKDVVWRSLQKGLLHITKLSGVYLEVLPTALHHEVVGSLLDVLVSEIVSMVLSMEDIAAADATELHTLLGRVIEKGPATLLLKSEENGAVSVSTYCKSWEKLEKVSIVLNASLLEIVDLWGDGREDSIAKHFSVSEVRGLIKALFKNTERRAAALSKISSR